MTSEYEEISHLAKTRAEKFHYEFTVDEYSLKKRYCNVGVPVDSPAFMVGGYWWTINFYPNGQTDKVYEQGCTSLFLSLMTQTDHHVPILFEMRLRDLSGNDNHHGRTIFNTFPPDITYAKYTSMNGYLNFIKRERLESSEYMKDDRLIIDCTLQILTTDIERLSLRNKEFDILVKVADETFHVNMSILSSHSMVFRSLIADAIRHQLDIIVRDVEPKVFKAILWFLYTGTLLEEEQEILIGYNLMESFMGQLLAAAHLYKLKKLKSLCQLLIMEKISIDVESIVYYLEFANNNHFDQLKDACIRFVSENREAVAESEGLEYLRRNSSTMYYELVGILRIEY